MIELPFIFISGVLGSSHCIGMCGGFAVSIGAASTNVRSNATRQLAWGIGRVFTYAFGGAVAGFSGARFASTLPIAHWQAWLAVVAGVVLIIQGLLASGVIPRRRIRHGGNCLSRSLFAPFLTAPGYGGVFLAGILTGFLPCGLVYAYLVLAASSGGLWHGMAIMATFGLGTLPVMVATGTGLSLLSLASRGKLVRAAAWCVVVTGALTIGRGIAFARADTESPPGECPLCETPVEIAAPAVDGSRVAEP